MITTLALLSAILCFGYIALGKIKFPKLVSLSDSYYLFNRCCWLFQVWAIGSAALILPAWLEVTPSNFQFVAFLSAVALGAVGTVPLFKTSQFWQHTISAGMAIILSVVWSLLIGVWYIALACYLLAIIGMLIYNRFVDTTISNPTSWLDKLMAKYHINDAIYWIEVGAFLSIYIPVFVKLLNK